MIPDTSYSINWAKIDQQYLSEMIVSFIVTNYNYADYLYKSVKSIALQTWRKLELIIIDDCSTDNSLQVIKCLKKDFDKRFIDFEYIINSENEGKLKALKRGIEKIKSPITIILDADDMLLPQFTEKTIYELYKKIQKDNTIAFVYTDCVYINREDKIICEAKSNEYNKQLLMKESYIPETAPTLTSVLKKASKLFNLEIKVGTKHHKWKIIVNNGWKGVYLPEPLLKYRMHSHNISGIGNRILNNGSSGSLLKDMKLNYNKF